MITTHTQDRRIEQPHRHRGGAPLLPPVIAYSALTVLAVAVPLALAGKGAWTSDETMLDVYTNHHDAVRAQALLAMAAAMPLVVLSAIFSDRIGRLGLRVPGRTIALAGGVAAATMLAISGGLQLALLGTEVQGNLALLQLGTTLATTLGGIAFAAFTGLLIAGIAVTGLLGRILPRPLALAGIALAVLGQLALLVSLSDALVPLLPVVRFGGIIWLTAAAATIRARS